jgi:methyltransferase OMS1, mitochondrial
LFFRFSWNFFFGRVSFSKSSSRFRCPRDADVSLLNKKTKKHSTGRNLNYYPPGVRLTATDCSEKMIEVFKEKAIAAKYVEVSKVSNSFRLENENSPNPNPPLAKYLAAATVADVAQSPWRSNQFDVVVDTFGLCSFEDPVAALREMKRVCRKASDGKRGKTHTKSNGKSDSKNNETDVKKKGGRIFLLEHGRSDWVWLSNILDRYASAHASQWGCYWNRDIEKIVRDAGLTIVVTKRFHFGTTYFIIATPE